MEKFFKCFGLITSWQTKQGREISIEEIVCCYLCNLIVQSILLIGTGTVIGSYPGNSHLTYTLLTPVTFDAKWTTPDEWTDTTLTTFGNTSNAIFRGKWELASFDPIAVNQYIIVEILNDNTSDAGDYWQFCFD